MRSHRLKLKSRPRMAEVLENNGKFRKYQNMSTLAIFRIFLRKMIDFGIKKYVMLFMSNYAEYKTFTVKFQ